MDAETRQYLTGLRSFYRAQLTENIMPFWLEHGWDHINGGVYTCLDREGNLMDSTKSVWFQGRCGFVCAYAYNTVEKNTQWLEFSKSCIDFLEQHCFDADGRAYFEVTADGRPLRMRRYVFSECFAAIAMAEYSKATGDKEYARKALAIFENVRRFLNTPGILEPKYTDELKAIGHSITMIMINTGARIAQVADDPSILEQADESIELIATKFLHPEFKALLEMVTPEGELIDTLAGRTINPGHCIETSWFLLDEEERRGGDEKLRRLALQILDWSWDWGWDEEFGGIINFRDCRNLPPQDYSQDMKFWWPQTEAMIAMLYAYKVTGNKDYLDKHRMAHDWAYAHHADPVYGEWYGYLHRDGTVAQPAKGNIFKGPFHIPRMLIKSIELIDSMLA